MNLLALLECRRGHKAENSPVAFPEGHEALLANDVRERPP